MPGHGPSGSVPDYLNSTVKVRELAGGARIFSGHDSQLVGVGLVAAHAVAFELAAHGCCALRRRRQALEFTLPPFSHQR